MNLVTNPWAPQMTQWSSSIHHCQEQINTNMSFTKDWGNIFCVYDKKANRSICERSVKYIRIYILIFMSHQMTQWASSIHHCREQINTNISFTKDWSNIFCVYDKKANRPICERSAKYIRIYTLIFTSHQNINTKNDNTISITHSEMLCSSLVKWMLVSLHRFITW